MIKDFVVNVNNLTKPTTDKGFGTILVVDNEYNIPYTLVADEGELIGVDAITSESKVYKLVKRLFDANIKPREVAVFGDKLIIDGSELETALDTLLNEQKTDWFFLVSTMNDDETITMLSKWVVENGKVYFATTQNLEVVELLESPNAAIGYHNDVDDFFTEGLARSMSMKEIGSATAKFQQIKGSVSSDISLTQLTKLHKNNGFSYIRRNGENYVSEGKMTDGSYVDIILGSYFIKFKLEEALFKLAIDNDKIAYNDIGIGMMVGEVETVLKTATRQGIILEDGNKGVYEVKVLTRNDMPRNDIANRKYNGISVVATVAGAIHEAEITIDLVI